MSRIPIVVLTKKSTTSVVHSLLPGSMTSSSAEIIDRPVGYRFTVTGSKQYPPDAALDLDRHIGLNSDPLGHCSGDNVANVAIEPAIAIHCHPQQNDDESHKPPLVIAPSMDRALRLMMNRLQAMSSRLTARNG